MKYLSLPLSIIKFWYSEGLVVLIRSWKNSLLYLEEDLAVGLMLKLLFVPLFHDATIVGRALSFLFRLSRILLGLVAFTAASFVILAAALVWFLSPFLVLLLFWPGLGWPLIQLSGWLVPASSMVGYSALGITFAGVTIFVYHLVIHPPKRLCQIKSAREVWQCSLVKKEDILWEKLLKNSRVINLLLYLEQTPDQFTALSAQFSESELEQKVWEVGKKLGLKYLQAEHFFVAGLLLYPGISQSLVKLELKIEDFIDALDFLQKKAEFWKLIWVFDEDFSIRHLKGVNRGWLGVPTPNLDAVSEDLTHEASKKLIPDFIGRVNVVSEVINILSVQQGRNVVIVGEPGCGKTGLVKYLAKRIVAGDAPAALATKRLISLDLTKLLSGVKTQGELAERVKNVFEEVEFSGNIILFVDEIQDLGSGQVGSEFNLYGMLLPYIENSGFQFIAATEVGSYTRILEKNGNFARLFAKIELPPASIEETVDILKNKAIDGERYRKIKTSLPALKSLAALTSQYVHTSVLPDSALRVYEECFIKAEGGWIKKIIIEKVIQERTSVPVGEIVESDIKSRLLSLESIIHKQMIDQEEAVSAVANNLRRAAAQLREKNRPIGSFLFVGPTGVGKTELAKILSEVYFQSKGNFLRLDMSEYQTADAISRLIGDSSSEGYLTGAVQDKPYTLILLDEFEKADPKVLTLFLQVLDDGRLTSGPGRTVDFTNTIIIATSNAASLTIVEGLKNGQPYEVIDKTVRDELLKIFKPELLNRFDGVVLFKPLTQLDLQKVVRLKLAALDKQLREQGYLLEFDEGLVQKLAEKGYDPILGARPLRRLIQDSLEAKLSTLILEGKLPKGEQFVVREQVLA